MGGTSLNIHEIGDVFIAIVEVIRRRRSGGGLEDKGAGGDGFRGIPNIGLEEDIFGAPELLDTEVVVVGEALEKVGIGRLSAHFDTAASLRAYLTEHPITGSHILLKGSRGIKLEEALEAL